MVDKPVVIKAMVPEDLDVKQFAAEVKEFFEEKGCRLAAISKTRLASRIIPRDKSWAGGVASNKQIKDIFDIDQSLDSL